MQSFFDITGLRFAAAEPWWLFLLLLIPLTIWWSFRSLAGLGPIRRWVALGLRCSLHLVPVPGAWPEVYVLHRNDTTTVLFLWDRSLSIPEEFDPLDTKEPRTDLVKERHLSFINNAVAQRGPTHQRDSAGLIVFGRYPRLELPPSSVPRFRFEEDHQHGGRDVHRHQRRPQACPGLLSRGNWQAHRPHQRRQRKPWQSRGPGPHRQAKRRRDRHRAGLHQRPEHNEILVERIEAPAVTEADTRMPIRIVIRSYNPQTVVGRLSLTKTSLQMTVDPADPAGQLKVTYEHPPADEKLVRVRLGLNAFYLQQPGLREEESYTYEAKFVPLGVEKTPINLDNANHLAKLDKEPVMLDRPENNYASTSVLARGEKKVLLIEPTAGDHALLLKTLRQSKASLKVGAITPADLPQDA